MKYFGEISKARNKKTIKIYHSKYASLAQDYFELVILNNKFVLDSLMTKQGRIYDIAITS